MQFTITIFRILFALLLLSSSLTVSAGRLWNGNVTGRLDLTGSVYSRHAEDVCEEQHHAPQHAVLSGNILGSGTAGIHTGVMHGGGVMTVATFFSTPLSANFEKQLRRWLLLFSAVRREQLTALYPAHAFW